MSLCASQSAAAMAAQMFSSQPANLIFKKWDQGASELYLEIAQFGELSASLSSKYTQDASGVYSYDVDSELGDFLAQEIVCGTYDFEKTKQKLQELVAAFYSGSQELNALDPFTVIGFDSDNDLYRIHVTANNPYQAFALAAKTHATINIVIVLNGHLMVGEDFEFPSDTLMDSQTILDLPDVFEYRAMTGNFTGKTNAGSEKCTSLINQVSALSLALDSAIKRIEIANAEGNQILSAWLPDARAALDSVDNQHSAMRFEWKKDKARIVENSVNGIDDWQAVRNPSWHDDYSYRFADTPTIVSEGKDLDNVRNLVIQRNEVEHRFKNFHKSLCDRFGYTHDEKDWKRDEVSLIEAIASKIAQSKSVSV